MAKQHANSVEEQAAAKAREAMAADIARDEARRPKPQPTADPGPPAGDVATE